MNILQFALSIAISISVLGCATKSDIYVNEIQRNGLNMVIMEEESKVTYLKQPQSAERFCASRETDSLKTSFQGMGLGVSSMAGNDNISEGAGSGAVALGGRSPAVLITRELMFRACELSLNLNADLDKTISVYKIFLDSIEKIVKSEHDIGSQTAVAEVKTIDDITKRQDTKSSEDDEDDEEDDDDE